jgi:choline dehydrogenase-like flavoprotein
MASTRQDGVVDPDGLVFECENLYVAGASVFPSAGFANPMLTIVALALRLARHVDASLG